MWCGAGCGYCSRPLRLAHATAGVAGQSEARGATVGCALGHIAQVGHSLQEGEAVLLQSLQLGRVSTVATGY